MSSMNRLGKRAVVLGGSIAGKLAARVLSDFYQEVIIIEQDQKNEKVLSRKGVPQGSHCHMLLKSGEDVLNELFPGIVEELIADGSVKLDFPDDVAWNYLGSWKMQFHSGISIIQQTRPFLESHIQRRLDTIPNISYLYGAKAKKLMVNHSLVEGVEILTEDNSTTPITADLVIDALGAASNTPQWLKQLGFDVPIKTEIKLNLSYISRIYRSLSSIKKTALLVYPNPPTQLHGGAIFPIENHRFLVTLAGYCMDSLPQNDEEFLAHAKTLEKPDIYQEIKKGQPETDIQVYRFPSSRRFHYEKLKHFPNGLVVIGDAYARLDPLFGQGMSVSALEAIALKKELKKALDKDNRNKISKNIHRTFSRIIHVPWLIAAIEGFRHHHTSGTKPFGLSCLQWYVKKVILACASNPTVYKNFLQVIHLKIHPINLLAPHVIKAILPRRGAKRVNKT